MDTDSRFMVKLLIDRHHRAATIIPDNLPPEEVQYIEEAINSENPVQEGDDESADLDGLVPDMDYCTTPLSIDNLK
jgi:hypothetical protein